MTGRELWRSVRLLFRRAQTEADFAEELSYHADMRTRELIAAGVDPRDARRRAESEMGGTVRLKEDLRDVHGTALLGRGENHAGTRRSHFHSFGR